MIMARYKYKYLELKVTHLFGSWRETVCERRDGSQWAEEVLIVGRLQTRSEWQIHFFNKTIKHSVAMLTQASVSESYEYGKAKKTRIG